MHNNKRTPASRIRGTYKMIWRNSSVTTLLANWNQITLGIVCTSGLPEAFAMPVSSQRMSAIPTRYNSVTSIANHAQMKSLMLQMSILRCCVLSGMPVACSFHRDFHSNLPTSFPGEEIPRRTRERSKLLVLCRQLITSYSSQTKLVSLKTKKFVEV